METLTLVQETNEIRMLAHARRRPRMRKPLRDFRYEMLIFSVWAGAQTGADYFSNEVAPAFVNVGWRLLALTGQGYGIIPAHPMEASDNRERWLDRLLVGSGNSILLDEGGWQEPSDTTLDQVARNIGQFLEERQLLGGVVRGDCSTRRLRNAYHNVNSWELFERNRAGWPAGPQPLGNNALIGYAARAGLTGSPIEREAEQTFAARLASLTAAFRGHEDESRIAQIVEALHGDPPFTKVVNHELIAARLRYNEVLLKLREAASRSAIEFARLDSIQEAVRSEARNRRPPSRSETIEI